MRRITDFKQVINDREALTVAGKTIYKYECPVQTIYLNEDGYAVNYEKQIITSDEYGIMQYYYLFITGDPERVALEAEHITRWEWKRNFIEEG